MVGYKELWLATHRQPRYKGTITWLSKEDCYSTMDHREYLEIQLMASINK
jgi:hypothetical protein